MSINSTVGKDMDLSSPGVGGKGCCIGDKEGFCMYIRRCSLRFSRKDFIPEGKLRRMKTRREMKLEINPEE